MSQPDVTLYHFPGSLCSQKVRLVLAEKRVPYRARLIDIELRMQNYEPGYVRLNPRGVVPTLVHGDEVVTDSARILRYVDEAFEGPSLVPVEPEARQRMEEWIERQDQLPMRELSYSKLTGLVGFLLRRITMPLRVSRLTKLRDANPDLAHLYQARLDDVAEWRETLASAERMAVICRDLEAVLDRAEEQLGKTTFLAADAYSLADVAWNCVLARLRMAELDRELWEEGRRPQLASYYRRLRARPSFREASIWEGTPLQRILRRGD